MKAKTSYLTLGLISLVLMSCSETHVQLSLRDYPSPVMVSPILRVGDTAPPKMKLSEFSRLRRFRGRPLSTSKSPLTAPAV